MDKDKTEEFLKKYNVVLPDVKGYDHVYELNSARADYFKSSIPDEPHLALYVKDVIVDVDGYPSMPFTRFYADCIAKSDMPSWEDVL